jgi:hypothetical protein
VDPIGLVRKRKGPSGEGFALGQYVNDRPYAASSFLSVAISRILGSALGGRSGGRQELADAPMPLVARLAALPCRGGEAFLRSLFEPLQYTVVATRTPSSSPGPLRPSSSSRANTPPSVPRLAPACAKPSPP